MIIPIIILLGIMLLGFPIYMGLLFSGAYVLFIMNSVPVDMVVTSMFDGIAKFSLAAVPFFLFAGSLMERSSLAPRLVNSINPWLVKMRGGDAIAAVMANEVFGAMSGSSAAAAGTIGRAMYPSVKKKYGERFGLGLFASCGSLAIIMPPSITMIIYSAATSCSTGKLFLAGIIPAMIIGVLLAAYIVFRSPKVKDMNFNLRKAVIGTGHGLVALFLPVAILGGIYGGVFTPTEAGAFSAVYAAVVGIILRDLKLKDIWACIKDTLRLTGQIFILMAVSQVFSQALAIASIPSYIASALGNMNVILFFVALNVVLLIVGCFFEPTSAVLILAPVILPLAQTLGISPIHLGIVFTTNLAIGMFTPPFGLNLFILQSIFKTPVEKIARAIVPFFCLYIIALMIITYCPQLYMWLAR